jgi:hypothetical protein
MAAIYSNGSNHWNILGFNFTKRDALSSLYKISMVHACQHQHNLVHACQFLNFYACTDVLFFTDSETIVLNITDSETIVYITDSETIVTNLLVS